MQFKNPEFLYFLFLLIIPILVHLFQLQKFRKTAFTNVAFLKKIEQQSRKSAKLKKWLILATRLLLFTSLVIVFAQPYFGTETSTKQQHSFIYLDNSLSMTSKGKKGELLQNGINELLENGDKTAIYSLQTNSKFYEKLSYEELKKVLITTKYTNKKTEIPTVLLKINNLKKEKTNTLYNAFLISDFQNINYLNFTDVNNTINLIKLQSTRKENISIDSVYYTNAINNSTIHIVVKNQGVAKNNVPIAIYNNDELTSKQVFSIDENEDKTIEFQLQNNANFKGKIELTYNDTYLFDNVFYFAISKPKKIAVLQIGKPNNYLKKIFTNKEFNLSETTQKNIDYNSISKQQFILLDELENIPESLQNSLLDFTKNGGEIAIIPNKKIQVNSYNALMSKLGFGKVQRQFNDTLQITKINFEHPLFNNVFSKKTTNFQYPFVTNSLDFSTSYASAILSLENKKPFVQSKTVNSGKAYLFSSSIQKENSNFTNSPLIVPLFYNMAKLSFKQNRLFYRTNETNIIDIPVSVRKDRVLQLSNKNSSFIPQQRTYQNKVALTVDNIEDNGFYDVKLESNLLETLAFNQTKEESNLLFLNEELLANNKNITVSNSVTNGLNQVYAKNEVQWLWKWFLGLAIVSLLLEILILKFFKR
ncbi:BatA domain-containing protein [Polaribacter sp.]|nr:BatA domain-containing protein [Polaribacter sp.]